MSNDTSELDNQLGLAVINKDFAKIKILVDQGANITLVYNNHTDGTKEKTLFTHICETLDLNMISYILTETAKIRADKLFLDAFRSNSIERMKQAVSLGANINLRDTEMTYTGTGFSNVTALIHAVTYEDIDIVDYLLQNGANTELSDDSGRTALIFAIDNNDFDIVKLLVKHNACINTVNSKYVPLISSLSKSTTSIFLHLIEKGANPNITDSTGWTPLMYAVEQSYSQYIKLLVSNGAKIDIKNKKGFTALMIAANNQRLDIVEYFVKNLSVHR